MRFPFKWAAGLVTLGVTVWAVASPLGNYLAERNRPHWREAKVVRRDVTLVVNSTGEIKPVQKVAVGAFVSGPVLRLHVDFNDRVKKGQLLAEIDIAIYGAAVARDQAALATQQAQVEQIKAQLQQAINDKRRSVALRAQNPDYISQTEIDRFHFAWLSLEAQLKVAKSNVKAAEATLKNSQANVGYSKITAPVDGIVIDRKIDPGQTLAASFQTPELFVIAPDMDKKMHVFASVDEADIGLIRSAQEQNLPVEFTVDAYPDDLFTGHVEQIRFSSTVTQNVVTYPVVVAVPNPDLKLLPGMTAELSFKIDDRTDVLCVPNAALRFYPEPAQVRQEDRALLEGLSEPEYDEDAEMSARQKAEAGATRNRRHVWVSDGPLLRAVEVRVGISDNFFTELVEGDLKEGQALVTGIEPQI
jgi:HlyD family secretion protein